MTDNKQFEINLTKTYTANLSAIINLFRDNTIFEFTGANEIESDFNTFGKYHLTFSDRGIIYGQFIKIEENELVLEWNVEGFQRPTELKTILSIHLQQNNEQCILTLSHKNIVEADSADAKRRAWKEVLEGLELKLDEINGKI